MGDAAENLIRERISSKRKWAESVEKQMRIGREIAQILERENLTIREACVALDCAKSEVQTSPVCCRK